MTQALLDNALDFIVRAASDLWHADLSPEQQLKYSTVELYEGIELILKARLVQEHWSLAVANIDKYKKDSYLDGSFVSVTFEAACKRLAESCDFQLGPRAQRSFDELRQLRNQYVHFQCNKPRPEVLAVQVGAWHYILRLLEDEDFLGPQSGEHQEIISSVKSKMLQSEEFLKKRYDELKPEISGYKQPEFLVASCPVCTYDSLILGDTGEGCPRCLVCETDESPERLADKYARRKFPWWKHPKEGPDDEVAWCDECEHQAAVPAGDDLRAQITAESVSNPPEPGEGRKYFVCFFCGRPNFNPLKCDLCGAIYFSSLCPICKGWETL